MMEDFLFPRIGQRDHNPFQAAIKICMINECESVFINRVRSAGILYGRRAEKKKENKTDAFLRGRHSGNDKV